MHELKFRGRRHVYMWVDVEGMRGCAWEGGVRGCGV